MDFSNIVKERAGQKQIAIDLRIIAAHQIARAEQRDDVIQQSADVGVMQVFAAGALR